MIEHAPHRTRAIPHRRFFKAGMDALVALLVALNWVATQIIAAALHYPAFFMGRIAGHIYQPFAWLWWQHHWPHSALRLSHQIIPLERAWSLCDRIVFYPTVALVVIGGLMSALLMKWSGPADLHGSAAWADSAEVKRTGLL